MNQSATSRLFLLLAFTVQLWCGVSSHSGCAWLSAQEPSAVANATQTGSQSNSVLRVPALDANQNWPAGTAARDTLPEARAVDYQFDDVAIEDIEGWLRWIGVELPVDVDGQLSGWVWGQRSDQGWFNFQNYRLEGAITSPLLSINDWFIADAIVRFGYRDGVWYVGSLRGRVRASRNTPPLGRVELAARLPTETDARIEVIGEIAEANLGAMVGMTDVTLPASGSGRLTLQASAPWSTAEDPSTWNAVSQLQLGDVQIAALPMARLDATAQLQAGEWSISRGELRWLPEPILISGSGRVDEIFPYEFSLRGAGIPLQTLLVDFDLPRWSRIFSGKATLVASLTGNASQGVSALSARVTAPELSAAGQAVENFNISAALDGDQLQVELAPLSLAQGRLAAVGRWASLEKLASGIPTLVDVELDDFDLAQLRRSLAVIERETTDARVATVDPGSAGGWNIPLDLSGVASGNVRWSSPDRTDRSSEATEATADAALLAQWRSSGDLRVEELVGFGNRLTSVSLDWSKRLADQQMKVDINAANDQLDAEFFLTLEDNPQLGLANATPSSYATSGSLSAFRFVFPADLLTQLDGATSVEATGTFTASGTTENPLLRGQFELTNVLTELARTPLQLQTALLTVTPDEFRLQRLQILDSSGRVAGGMVWRRDTQGQHQLNLRLVDFQLEYYARLLRPDARTTGTTSTARSIPFAGSVNGEVRLTKDASTLDWLTGWQGTIDGNIEQLILGGTQVGTLVLGTQLGQERAQIEVAGTVLGGQAAIDTELPVTQLAAFFGLDADDSQPRPHLVSVRADSVDASQEETSQEEISQPPGEGESQQSDINGDTTVDDSQNVAPEQPPAVEPLRLNINWTDFSLPDMVRLLPDPLLRELTADLFAGPTLETMEGTATIVGSIEIPIAGQFGRGETLDLSTWYVDLRGSLINLSIQQLALGTVDFDVSLRQAWLDATLEGSLLAGPIVASVETDLAAANAESVENSEEQPVAPDRIPSLQLRWDRGQLQRLSAFVAAVPWSPTVAGLLNDYDLSTLAGSLSLDARFERQGASDSPFSGWQGAFTATTDQLLYRQTLIGDVVAQGNLQENVLDATVNGELLGGEIDLRTEVPGELWEAIFEEPTATTEENAASMLPRRTSQPAVIAGNWLGADVGRLAQLITDPRTARLLAGRLSVRSDSSWSPADGLQGDATVSLPVLAHGRNTLVRQLAAKLQFAENSIRLLDVAGFIAGGRLRASGTLPISLATSQISTNSIGERIQFDAQRIDLNQLLQLFAPAYADEYAGLISYRGTAVLDRLIVVTGDAHATDGLVYGLPIQRGHGTVRVSLNRDLTLDQLSTNNLTGTAIGGNLVGEVRLSGGSRTGLTAVARVGNGKLDQLSRAAGFEHVVGTGRFDARIDLASRELFDLSELAGAVQIDFEGGDAQSLPILTELGRFVPVLTLASTDILGGRLRGRIGQGQLRISDFLLLGDAFWVAGEGNAGLLSGRLDLNAVIETGGRGLAANVGQAASRQLVSLALPQLALISELNQLLSNRSLYLHIAGTTSSPVVQAQVAPTLARAVLRTVRQRLLVIPAIGGATEID